MASSAPESGSIREKEKQNPVVESVSVNTTTTNTPPMEDDVAGQAGDKGRTLWQNIKRYRKTAYITLGLTSAILLYGYDNVIVGTVTGMPAFQKDFGMIYEGKWILPADWLGVWTAASPLGAMGGALFGGWFQDRVGRRTSLVTSSFLSAIGVAVMFVSYIPATTGPRRVLFLVGKLIQGFSIGTNISTAQTYLSEILPPSLRASAMSLLPAFTCLGQIIGALVIYSNLEKPRGYVVAFGSQWPFSVLPILVAFLIPESPKFYMRKGHYDKARTAQARLNPPDVNPDAAAEKLKHDVEAEKAISESTSVMECFRGVNLRRTLIVLWAQALQSVFGLALLSKASYFLQVIGMTADKSIIFLILGLVFSLLSNLTSIWIVAHVGRRKLIMTTLSMAAMLWLSMGIANCFQRQAVIWWSGVSMVLTATVCGLGVWPASFAVSSESSSLKLRARTQGMGWFVNSGSYFIAGYVLPYIYNPDAGNLRGRVAFTYFASCVLGVGISWWAVPEMKGRSVEEVDKMFEQKIGARKWEGWCEEGDASRAEEGSAEEQEKV
ncbi:MFS general substrate transporter [Periconia macrospinosa]|uniref:MFS general substrate transporter n=1 Tax=Periconia macrospinosa TaxID=97972 RepID=A0A2V1DJR6_9PLEO|nr:MFS general substrate transporter [Periconia macrospinosa]